MAIITIFMFFISFEICTPLKKYPLQFLLAMFPTLLPFPELQKFPLGVIL